MWPSLWRCSADLPWATYLYPESFIYITWWCGLLYPGKPAQFDEVPANYILFALAYGLNLLVILRFRILEVLIFLYGRTALRLRIFTLLIVFDLVTAFLVTFAYCCCAVIEITGYENLSKK